MSDEDDEYDVVNSDNFRIFQWKSKTHVNICKCIHSIPLTSLGRCKRSLTKIWFQYPTLAENVLLILQNCPNLVDLSFEDSLINEYRPSRQISPSSRVADLTKEDVIVHPNLEVLELTNSMEKLSSNEYWILDFLTRRAFFERLKIFTFWKNLKRLQPQHNNQRERPILETNEVMENHCPILEDENIVAKFILRHQRTLQSLWLGGTGFRLCSPGFKDQNLLRDLELESFTCTFNGESPHLQIFMEKQRKLKKLILFSRFDICHARSREMFPGFMTRLFNCVARNALTLTEVIIYPKIVYRDKERREILEENLILETFSINCDIFAHCPCLESLALGLLCFPNLTQYAEGWPTLLGARIFNLHHVPSILKELQIFAEDYSKVELSHLEFNCSMFQRLEKFSLSTSPLKSGNEFLVKLQWIKDLSQLPKIKEFSFFNFAFEDPQAVGQFVGNRDRHWTGAGGNARRDYEVAITLSQVMQTYGQVDGVTFRVTRFIV